jgi:transcriptional regulator with XRE-family HTH domain
MVQIARAQSLCRIRGVSAFVGYVPDTTPELVRRARLLRGLTRTELAHLAGVSPSTVSRIEAGKADPAVSTVKRIIEAAGYRYRPPLEEAGSDQPYADALEQLASASPSEREAILRLLPAVAATSPPAARAGMRRAAVPGDVATAVQMLADQGQEPVVSALEGVEGRIDRIASFVPIVYVDDPRGVQRFGPVGKISARAMLLLETTANVKRFTRREGGTAMVTREWAFLDSMASPGRQADIAIELFEYEYAVDR